MALYFLNEEAKAIFEDKEKLLFKVLPLSRIMESLEKGRWAFVSPTLWKKQTEFRFHYENY